MTTRILSRRRTLLEVCLLGLVALTSVHAQTSGTGPVLTGWMLDPKSKDVWGRPVGLLVLNDGSMLITDDGANKIWRVTYRK